MDEGKTESQDIKSAAALRFVDVLLQRRGLVTDTDFADVKSSGWTDEEISEMIAHVALNVFSNYFNHVALPQLDFPMVAVNR